MIAHEGSDLLLMFALLILDFSFQLLDSSTGDTFSLYGGLCFQIMLLHSLNILRLHMHTAATESVDNVFGCLLDGVITCYSIKSLARGQVCEDMQTDGAQSEMHFYTAN